jgi:polyisoprenoid-binding protein YceI
MQFGSIIGFVRKKQYIMKTAITIIAAVLISFSADAQKFATRNGYLGFFSATKQENIKADNNKVTYVIDLATGAIEISALHTAFQFEKALMQEHYNENYVEAEKYPKATFKGKIDMTNANLTKDGTYKTKITGDLTMHGVTNKTTVDATFVVSGGKITAESKFPISCKAFNIAIPSPVKDVISDKIDVTAKATLEEFKK